MRAFAIIALVLSLPVPTRAEEPLRVTYRTYAVGAQIAEAEARIGLGPWSYQIALAFRTTGLARLVVGGQHTSSVYGVWHNDQPAPREYASDSSWHGEQRTTLIDYNQGIPEIRRLLPPPEPDQETVGLDLRANSTDVLSALGALIRAVQRSGRCDSTLRTFDGRRAADITAHTVGMEVLDDTDRSSFSGKALRCDFVSRVLAGFRADQADKTDYRPLHGSVWLAAPVPNRSPVPVRLTVETRWFGDVTSYLTGVNGSDQQ